MKELINFIKWQWNKWEFWQKSFILSSLLFGAGAVAEPPYSIYLFVIPAAVILFWATKWLVWDGTRRAWLDYKKEKADLFHTIRTGQRDE